MAAFHFKFEPLLRYRKNRLDLCQQLLAQVLTQQAELSQKKESLRRNTLAQLDELRALGREPSLRVERAATRRQYVGQLAVEIRVVEQCQNIVARQIDLCRRTVLLAERDVKVLEKLEEKHAAEFHYLQQRLEVRTLDESWRPSAVANASS